MIQTDKPAVDAPVDPPVDAQVPMAETEAEAEASTPPALVLAAEATACVPLSDTARATLQRLLEHMQSQQDFPVLSARMQAIQRLDPAAAEPLQRVAEHILRDFGLTQKLLRLVNSAFFRREEQSVSTIPRAVALVGLGAIRNLAVSLVLVEHMKDRDHAQRLARGFAQALMAGQLAHDLARNRQEADEAFLAAVMQNLGTLVAEYYFPVETQEVRLRAAKVEAAQGRRRFDTQLLDQAAEQVLGLSFDTLGAAVADYWAMQPEVLQAMRHPAGASPPRRLGNGPDRLRWLATVGNEAAAALMALDPKRLQEALAQVTQRHGRALDLDTTTLGHAVEDAWTALVEMARNLGLQLPPRPRSSPPPAVTTRPPAAVTARPPATAAVDAAATARPQPRSAIPLLSAGVQNITLALASDTVPVRQIMQLVLDTMYRALECRRVVVCLRDPDGSRLTGRLGLGAGRIAGAEAQNVQVMLRPPPGQAPDALARAALAGEDLWVAPFDAGRGSWPGWLAQESPGALFALPLRLRGQLLALIYAEHDQTAGWDDAERALLCMLRSQAQLALRPAG